MIDMWMSMIWKGSLGCGIYPDSILDQNGLSLREISNAPVLISEQIMVTSIISIKIELRKIDTG